MLSDVLTVTRWAPDPLAHNVFPLEEKEKLPQVRVIFFYSECLFLGKCCGNPLALETLMRGVL